MSTKSINNEVNSAKLAAYVDEITARLDENSIVESLVKELAIQRLTQDELVRNLTSMKAYMTMRDILLPEAIARYEGIRQIKIDAAMPIKPDKGFYGIEHTDKGLPFRWTGPENSFFFDLHLCRTTPLKFSLSLARWGTAPSNKIRCFSDNKEIPLTKKLTSLLIEYSGVLLPREALGVTRLEFSVAKMFKPNPADNLSPLLGVVFDNFTVDPATEREVEECLDMCDALTDQENDVVEPANTVHSPSEG
ncbi:MAG: hypothetical protein ACXWT7_09860 [Methylophilaceae bacterium]